jgi:hypothetical protein
MMRAMLEPTGRAAGGAPGGSREAPVTENPKEPPGAALKEEHTSPGIDRVATALPEVPTYLHQEAALRR